MSRAIYEALFEADSPLPEGLELVAAVARASQGRQEVQALARTALEEGRYAKEEENAAVSPIRLAAADVGRGGVYSAGPWVVRTGLSADRVPMVEMEQGPGPATLLLPSGGVTLFPDETTVLNVLPALDEALVLLDAEGLLMTLKPQA